MPHYSPLLTDLYQLTMAYGYWKLNIHEQEAAFHLLFRKTPFDGNYVVNCGLASVVDFLQQWHFAADDLTYLATLKNNKNARLFSADFLDYLAKLSFTGTLHAIPEGTIVFPNEPLLRVQGSLLQCQLIESALLNTMNFQSLIATKAARVCQAADHDTVIEFGLRRAQGPDGAVSASRAAYIGGCHATSNTLAGKLFDIPVRGTHAHSWVTAFPDEMSAFTAYADVMPDNCVLLVDTYNTIEGVKHAIEIGQRLHNQQAELVGIRLDSGDLADLSIKARDLLDKAGFQQTSILASNSLDEHVITALKSQGAQITAWGVGTNLVTAYDHPALDGVYKLSALYDQQLNAWLPKLKISEQEIKTSNPGRHQVRRFFCGEQYAVDVIYDLDLGIADATDTAILGHLDQLMRLDGYDGYVDLLQLVIEKGKLVQPLPSIHDTRKLAREAITQFLAQHQTRIYPVGLEKKLAELKIRLTHELKNSRNS